MHVVKVANKSGVTVKQFAEEIGVNPDRLLSQFREAGIPLQEPDDLINETQKQKLLQYLQQNHGAKSKPASTTTAGKIVLQRAKTSEIRLGGSHQKTVSIQVRKKRTYLRQAEAAAEHAAEQVTSTSEAPAAQVATPPTDATSVSTAPESNAPDATTDAKAPVTPADDKTKLPLKKKEKHGEVDEEEGDRQKKKKKARDATYEADKGFEALLTRGADLKRVLQQADEEEAENALRKSQKIRASHLAKIKIQAFVKPTARIVHDIPVPPTLTVTELAQRMSVKATEVMKILVKMGVMANINQSIDQDTAVLVVEEMGHRAKPLSHDSVEDELTKLTEIKGTPTSRPPVITIMGHVDHGKTTLLDYIRTTKVAASEAGGITQHIGAYHVQIPKGTITFLDTPGHAAFTAMRARGAKLTDIVILVVAQDDGAMPQTIEAIQHAKAANVPIVVAVNKMDKSGADADRVKQELTQHGLIPEEWGGEAMFVPISAKTGMGVDQLLDSILVQAEVLELKAVADCPARGVVIESRLDKRRGIVMTVLVQQGTLRQGDIILAGLEYGRIRALFNETGATIANAGPSIPVELLGFSGLPQAGDDFIVLPDEKTAREVAAHRQEKHRAGKLAKQAVSMEDLMKRIETEKQAGATINLVVKADVLGSIEALKHALTELSDAEVKINVIASGIGGINESDVNLAIASGAVIIAFNVRANSEARKLIEAQHLPVHYHNIIYDVVDQVKKIKQGAMAPVIQEKVAGIAQVRDLFRSSKTGTIAGCMVIEGTIKRSLPVRILRDNVVIFEGTIESLRRFKDDVSEVRHGMECGIGIKNYGDIKVGDQIEVFERTEVRQGEPS
jgi:translation initiation factor IF-2